MQKITVAFEKRCEKTGHILAAFNGRFEPVTSPLSLESQSKLDLYTRITYNNIIVPKDEHQSDSRFGLGNYLFKYADPLNHEFKLVSDLTDEVYIYPVEIVNSQVYLTYTSHIAISDKVRTDIINNRAYLIFSFPFEGDLGGPFYSDRFRELINKLNLPKERIYLIHGNYDTAIWKEEPYMYHPVNTFPWWLMGFKRDTIIDFIPDKLYNCYNRRMRRHRIIVMLLLFRANLVNKGIVSFGDGDIQYILRDLSNSFSLTHEDYKFIYSFMGTSPDSKTLLLDDNLASNVEDDHYRRSFVSLVNETLTDSLFYTEKIYKPILVGHPFLLMGTRYQLRQLREFGFKTFGKWWDESYDELETEVDRATHIVKILSDLNTKSPHELIAIRAEMEEILIHNQQVFNGIIKDTPYWADTPTRDFLVELLNIDQCHKDSVIKTNPSKDWRKRLAQFSGNKMNSLMKN